MDTTSGRRSWIRTRRERRTPAAKEHGPVKNIHLIGIGGVGMSALAQALVDAGNEVSGADRSIDDPSAEMTPALAALASQGVKLFPDDGSGVSGDTSRVIVSTAIEDDNPGLAKARALGIPVVHRAAALAELLSGHRLAAVAGTCGKSTVTAILGHILAAAGFDPVVVNGAAVAGWSEDGARVGSVRRGRGQWAVAEVDESDKSLMSFSPAAAVITNASADHFGIEETEALFDGFRDKVSGPCFDCRKDPARPENVNVSSWSSSFDFEGATWTVPMPGAHNAENAFNAVRLARAMGADATALRLALATFPGVERRLQKVGMCGEAVVVDDYAHNPAKLAAMWSALAGAFPAGVAVVWRPHGYGPLHKMLSGLAAAFMSALRPQDALLLLPVYDAGGTADRSVASEHLSAKLAGAAGIVECVASLDDAERRLRELAPRMGAVVTAGARDPGLPVLARRLASS